MRSAPFCLSTTTIGVAVTLWSSFSGMPHELIHPVPFPTASNNGNAARNTFFGLAVFLLNQKIHVETPFAAANLQNPFMWPP